MAMLLIRSAVAWLTFASCVIAVAVAVMKFMVARARSLRYPILAGNSDLRRFGCGESGEQQVRVYAKNTQKRAVFPRKRDVFRTRL